MRKSDIITAVILIYLCICMQGGATAHMGTWCGWFVSHKRRVVGCRYRNNDVDCRLLTHNSNKSSCHISGANEWYNLNGSQLVNNVLSLYQLTKLNYQTINISFAQQQAFSV